MAINLEKIAAARLALDFVVKAKRDGMIDHREARDFLTEVLLQVGFEKKDSAVASRRG